MATLRQVCRLRRYLATVTRAPSSLSVTQFTTQVCELKGLYALEEPQQPTPAMGVGTRIHAQLEARAMAGLVEEVPTHTIVTAVDEYATKLWNMGQRLLLLDRGYSVRELRVAGTLGSIIVTGVIDFVDISPAGLVLGDTKTTLTPPPAPSWKARLAYHQLLLYHVLFTQLMTPGFDVMRHFGRFDSAERVAPGIAEVTGMATMGEYYTWLDGAILRCSQAQLKLSPELQVTFIHQRSRQKFTERLAYDETVSRELLDFRLSLWEGRRAPLPFSPDMVTVCRSCQYRAQCEFLVELGCPP